MHIFRREKNQPYRKAKVTPFVIRKTVSSESMSRDASKDSQGRPKHSADEMVAVKAKLRWVDEKLKPSTDFRESAGFGRSLMVNLSPGGRQDLFNIFHLELAEAACTTGVDVGRMHFIHSREIESTEPPAYTERPRRNDIRVTKVSETRGLPTFDGRGDTFVYWVMETPEKVPSK